MPVESCSRSECARTDALILIRLQAFICVNLQAAHRVAAQEGFRYETQKVVASVAIIVGAILLLLSERPLNIPLLSSRRPCPRCECVHVPICVRCALIRRLPLCACPRSAALAVACLRMWTDGGSSQRDRASCGGAQVVCCISCAAKLCRSREGYSSMADGQELHHSVQSQEIQVDVDAAKATDKILAAFDSMDVSGDDLQSLSPRPSPLLNPAKSALSVGRDEKRSSKGGAAADGAAGWEERIAADSGWL